MNNLHNLQSVPEWYKFVKSTLIILIIALTINTAYYLLFDLVVKTPIPDPYGLKAVVIQTILAVLLNGFIHYKQRKLRKKHTFGFVSTLLILIVSNLLLGAFIWDVRKMPSINEMNRLYGEQRVPDVLFLLSAPIALIPCVLGMFGIPAIVYGKRSEEEVNLVQSYRSKTIQLVKVHLIISTLLILINILYFSIYINLTKNIPTGGFSLGIMIQMTLAMTAVSVLLYLFITDNGKQSLPIYIMLTFCFTISAFLTSLPRPEGQPIYDNSLWLHIPLAIFSLLAETIGIPLVFRNLEKTRKEREEKDKGWN